MPGFLWQKCFLFSSFVGRLCQRPPDKEDKYLVFFPPSLLSWHMSLTCYSLLILFPFQNKTGKLSNIPAVVCVKQAERDSLSGDGIGEALFSPLVLGLLKYKPVLLGSVA